MNQKLTSESSTVLSGKYRANRKVGENLLADFYEAESSNSARIFQATLFKDRPHGHARWCAEFIDQTLKLRRLQHSQLVSVIDGGISRDQMYLVLERPAGETLRALLAERSLTVAELRQLLSDIGAAAAAMHAQGLVHGHLGLDSIFHEHGRFRLAGFIPPAVELVRRHISADTSLGFDPLSVAPEQITNGPRTPATDVYALAAVAYRALIGRAPFEADDPLNAAMLRMSSGALPISCRRPEISVDLDNALSKALLRKADERFVSMTDFLLAAGLPAPEVSALLKEQSAEQMAEAVAELALTADRTPAPQNALEALERDLDPQFPAMDLAALEREYGRAYGPESFKSRRGLSPTLLGVGLLVLSAFGVLTYNFSGSLSGGRGDTAELSELASREAEREEAGRQAQIKQLIREGEQLYQQGQLRAAVAGAPAAEAFFQQVLRLDPNNQFAARRMMEISDRIQFEEHRVERARLERQQVVEAQAAETERSEQLAKYLEQARKLKALGRFVGPEGESALDYVRKARELDPQNALARELSYDMAAMNIVLGDDARLRGDVQTTKAYLDAAAKFGADAEWLNARSERLGVMERSRSELVIIQRAEPTAGAKPPYLANDELEARVSEIKRRYGYAE